MFKKIFLSKKISLTPSITTKESLLEVSLPEASFFFLNSSISSLISLQSKKLI